MELSTHSNTIGLHYGARLNSIAIPEIRKCEGGENHSIAVYAVPEDDTSKNLPRHDCEIERQQRACQLLLLALCAREPERSYNILKASGKVPEHVKILPSALTSSGVIERKKKRER